ncbi:MAG: mandelate racemase/muconate lactonizing enzyme family protein [Chloroflexi bacterium]|nr:mandelate racemase/muconate lactonizing enzyme family protein [Chloroflexota bacterium]
MISFEEQANAARGQYKITDIKAMTISHVDTVYPVGQQQGRARTRHTFIKVETDAGLSGYGPCGGSGRAARDVIAMLKSGYGRHMNLSPIGKDPLAIEVHFHNLFRAVPQRGNQVRILSGIDIALWDLAGKILNQPVSKLLGGNFRDEIPLYSHCPDAPAERYLDKGWWHDTAQELLEDPRGFRAFKVDIHHALGTIIQQVVPSIGPEEARKVQRMYALAREAFGPDVDIIVHCHDELDVPSAIRVAKAVAPIDPLYYEDPLDVPFSEAWMMLRRATDLPIMTGENLALPDQVLPFLQNGAIDVLQPDLVNVGGITGGKKVADLCALFRIPITLHNVSSWALNMASQQFAAAIFDCPMMECLRYADRVAEAASNAPVIRNGKQKVSTLPGLGLDFNQEYLKAHLEEGEPWWG